MNESEKDQRRYALAVSGGICEVCGVPLKDGQPQAAHRIGNTQSNRDKYGSFVIDHFFNVGYVCSLGCNQKLDISTNPAKCSELCVKIYKRESLKFGGLS